MPPSMNVYRDRKSTKNLYRMTNLNNYNEKKEDHPPALVITIKMEKAR